MHDVVGTLSGIIFVIGIGFLVRYVYFKKDKKKAIIAAVVAAVASGFIIPIALVGGVVYWIKYRGRNNSGIVRGSSLLSQDQLQNILNEQQNSNDCGIWMNGIYLPKYKETHHTFIIGSAGSGKTNAINMIVYNIRTNKQAKAIIHDTKGDYTAKFYNPETDYILNPLDVRCVKWNIWNDIKGQSDFITIANTLIPENQKSDPFFYITPRRILADILQYLYDTNQRTNKSVWDAVNLTILELGESLKSHGLSAANDLLGNQQTASNLMSTVINACAVFRFMQHVNGSFSIEKFINNTGSGFIYLSNKQEIKELIQPILSLFIDISVNRLLSLPDDRDRRLYYVLDELNNLGKLNSLINLLTLSRSKGGSVFIGTQDFGEIDTRYGQSIRKTIINNCGNSIILRVQDPDVAEYLSKKVSDAEVWEDSYSKTSSKNNSSSVQTSIKSKRLVLPIEIMNLLDLEAITTVSGLGTFWTTSEYHKFKDIAESFIERPIELNKRVVNEPQQIDSIENENLLPEIHI